jgi:hypothetical protein
MPSILIKVTNQEDCQFLQQLVAKMGFTSLILADKKVRKIARKRLSEIPNNIDVDMTNVALDIQSAIKQVRSETYKTA